MKILNLIDPSRSYVSPESPWRERFRKIKARVKTAFEGIWGLAKQGAALAWSFVIRTLWRFIRFLGHLDSESLARLGLLLAILCGVLAFVGMITGVNYFWTIMLWFTVGAIWLRNQAKRKQLRMGFFITLFSICFWVIWFTCLLTQSTVEVGKKDLNVSTAPLPAGKR